jgi:hypothetical protein
MRKQEEFAGDGVVSIWIGNFSTDAEFDNYMNLAKDFEKDYGFKIDNRSVREAAVASASKPIDELVVGFSNWESFGSKAAELAKKMGIQKATTMIVFYNVKFDPFQVHVNPAAPLKFLGVFPF